MENLAFLPGSEPFFFRGNKIGLLLIHGFTATPYEMRALGEHLAKDGYTVLGQRLAHHATDPADMNRSHWEDWYFSALDGWHILRAQCDKVLAIGVSMGGATSLMLAANVGVSAVCTLGAPIYLHPDWRMPLTRYVWPVYPNTPRLDPNWREAVGDTERIAYPGFPVRATAELAEYLKEIEARLSSITIPTLLMHARIDMTAPPGSMDAIYNGLGSEDKQKVWVPTDKHVFVEEPNPVRPDVFAKISAFVARVAAG